MTEEQLTVRYMRGWIGLADYKAGLVQLHDLADAKAAAGVEKLARAYIAWVRGYGDRTAGLSRDAGELAAAQAWIAALNASAPVTGWTNTRNLAVAVIGRELRGLTG